MVLIIIILVAVVAVTIILSRQTDEPAEVIIEHGDIDNKYPGTLLDLDTTTIEERQRFYRRGYRLQMQYDLLQRMAEEAGDTYVLEALRTNTYKGMLPELEDEATDMPDEKRSNSTKQAKETGVRRLRYFCIKKRDYFVTVWPKDQTIPDYIEFNIAGIKHVENIDDYIGEHKGKLEADPANPYDANAIKILARDGHHVGYVPRYMTASIRQFTTLPCTCYFYIGENDGIYFSDAYINK